MLNSIEEEITTDILVLWALRICVSDFSCVATISIIRDWLGRKADEFIENIQLIYWANSVAGDLDCRFLPCGHSSLRLPESLLLGAIEAQMEGDTLRSHSACLRLAGNLAEFTQSAVVRVSSLLSAIQASEKQSFSA